MAPQCRVVLRASYTKALFHSDWSGGVDECSITAALTDDACSITLLFLLEGANVN